MLHTGDVSQVDVYRAVVLGAPIYNGRWHRDGRRFLRRHRKALTQLPVAIFALGPRTTDEEDWARSWGQLTRSLTRFRWLKPASIELFGGVDPPMDKYEPRRDIRDRGAIAGWAWQIADSLQAAEA